VSNPDPHLPEWQITHKMICFDLNFLGKFKTNIFFIVLNLKEILIF